MVSVDKKQAMPFDGRRDVEEDASLVSVNGRSGGLEFDRIVWPRRVRIKSAPPLQMTSRPGGRCNIEVHQHAVRFIDANFGRQDADDRERKTEQDTV